MFCSLFSKRRLAEDASRLNRTREARFHLHIAVNFVEHALHSDIHVCALREEPREFGDGLKHLHKIIKGLLKLSHTHTRPFPNKKKRTTH